MMVTRYNKRINRPQSGREWEAPPALPVEGATCLPAGTARAPKDSGFTILGVIITIGILAAFGGGLAVMVASNQSARTQMYRSDQAYYSNHAALEFAMRQIQVDLVPFAIPARDFVGEALTITRTGGQVWSTTTEGEASAAYRIVDPNPPTDATCLVVDVAGAVLSADEKNLLGIDLSRISDCPNPVTIISMTISWEEEHNEKLLQIQIEGDPKEYEGVAGQSSGSTFDFSSDDYTINDYAIHDLTHIRWNQRVDDIEEFTLLFNMSDGSQKSVEIEMDD
ncbi:MAG: hypothetical protein Q7S68_00140 [Deltaproteobacteria bacterium]|nr:hypothetical protein [Deltaproteobacteria bacterium]